MKEEKKSEDVSISLEELAIYNMLLSEAIFEILADKDIPSRAEVTECIKKLKSETKVNLRGSN